MKVQLRELGGGVELTLTSESYQKLNKTIIVISDPDSAQLLRQGFKHHEIGNHGGR